MMRVMRVISGAILGATLLLAGSAPAQDKSPAKQGGAAPDAARAVDLTKPGPEQAALAKLAGEYMRVVKFVGPQGAGTTPSTGTAKLSVVLGGRFLLEESMDTVFGKPVEGMRLYGYNNVTRQYQMVRMYTLSTAITMMTGTSSDGGRTIDFTGTSETPGGKMPLHAQLRQANDDEFAVTLFTPGPDGKEAAFQETDYTRKK